MINKSQNDGSITHFFFRGEDGKGWRGRVAVVAVVVVIDVVVVENSWFRKIETIGR